MRVAYSRAADSDVKKTFVRLAAVASTGIADRFFAALDATTLVLQDHPRSGKLLRAHHARGREYRLVPLARPFDAWLLIYRVTDEEVTVVAVRHGARDLGGLMRRLGSA